MNTSAENRTYYYTLGWERPNEHNYQVSFTTEKSAGEVTNFRIPAWRPGRYILQNFASSISRFKAVDEAGKTLSWKKTDKDTWQIKNPSGKKITISYIFYANILDAGSSILTPGQAYFNPANLFMYVEENYDAPCTLEIKNLPADWKIASALLKTEQRNVLRAESYHDFIDSPTILSPTLKQFSFQVEGVNYYVHFQGKYGATPEDERGYVDQVTKIIREQAAIFGGKVPLKEYHFIYQLCSFRIRHAVEHTYSSMYALPENVAEANSKFGGLMSITSHEFWHLWNVKRIRPAALVPYQYRTEAYTGMHWFTEGVTSYYTDLALVRGGIYSRQDFLNLASDLFQGLENSHAATVVSCVHSSFDSWLTTSNYVNPYHRISFYDLGHRSGMLLDLKLIAMTNGKVRLDDVFVDLYNTYYAKGAGYPEDGVQKSAEKLTGKSLQSFFDDYVNGTKAIDYQEFLSPFGIETVIESEKNASYRTIGIDKMDFAMGETIIGMIRPGSDAADAGLCDKDIVKEINGKPVGSIQPEDFFAQLKLNSTFTIKVISEGKEKVAEVKYTGKTHPKTLDLKISEKLTPSQKQNLDAWLNSRVK